MRKIHICQIDGKCPGTYGGKHPVSWRRYHKTERGKTSQTASKDPDGISGSRDSFLSQNESNGYCDRTPYELPADPEIGKRRKGKRTAPYGGTSGRVYLSIPAQYERRSKAKGRNCTGTGVRTRDHCM